MTQQKQFQQKFVIIYGVIFIWLAFGVYFKNSIGEWFSAIYYVLSIGLTGIFLYHKYVKKEPTIIKGEIIDVSEKKDN